MTRVALLDVNVLVALFDPDHVHHEPAHAWFAKNRAAGWATCPLTENGLIRILSNPSYSPAEERPHQVAERLETFCASGDHVFWQDAISMRDRAIFRLQMVRGHRQLTDVFLLAVATSSNGRLATFDRSIPLEAVTGADADRLAVIPV